MFIMPLDDWLRNVNRIYAVKWDNQPLQSFAGLR
jgi:hypothetical protein